MATTWPTTRSSQHALPGRATDTGMVPSADRPAWLTLIDPAVMGPPVVWLASPQARDVHDQRIVATGFEAWLAGRTWDIR
jgi:gluconate 5-dehydrogenase